MASNVYDIIDAKLAKYGKVEPSTTPTNNDAEAPKKFDFFRI